MVVLEELEQYLRYRIQISMGDLGTLHKLVANLSAPSQDLLRLVQGTHGEERWLHLNAGVVQHRDFKHVLGKVVRCLVCLRNLHEALQERVGRDKVNVEVKC